MDEITVAEARELLGISKPTMAGLIKCGVFTVRVNELDRRERLIPRAQVEAMLARARRPRHSMPD